jgi:hypothetical protein
LCALTKAKSAKYVYSKIYFLPFITFIGFGFDSISGIGVPGTNFIGIPPA